MGRLGPALHLQQPRVPQQEAAPGDEVDDHLVGELAGLHHHVHTLVPAGESKPGAGQAQEAGGSSPTSKYHLKTLKHVTVSLYKDDISRIL